MPIGNFLAVETASEVDLVEYSNVTMQDAIQFGLSTDTWVLTGQNFRMEVKASRDDAVAITTFTSIAGQIVVLDAINRIIQFNVPMSVIDASLPVGEYVYDLIMYDGSSPSIRTMLMFGKLIIKQGVSET
jgi:hypothetical protein